MRNDNLRKLVLWRLAPRIKEDFELAIASERRVYKLMDRIAMSFGDESGGDSDFRQYVLNHIRGRAMAKTSVDRAFVEEFIQKSLDKVWKRKIVSEYI